MKISLLPSLLFAVGSLLALASRCAAEGPPGFNEIAPPFLKTYCLDCHSGESPEGDLPLETLRTGEQLVTDRDLADRLLDMLQFRLMPPEDSEQPPPEAVERLVSSMQAVLDHADRNAPRNPGRVTMRRLNRTEYANTVRDLLGIDFNPAADFPADDVGHGFDNIGDVLTLPPLLMERYLAAAETISERALSTAPPIPEQRNLPANETEPALPVVIQLGFRAIETDHQGEPTRGGPIFARYEVPEGKYLFLTRAYADAPENQIVRIAILACSPQLGDDAASAEELSQLSGPLVENLRPFKVVEFVEVKSRKELLPRDVPVKIPAIPGLNRIAIAVCRPAEGEPPVTVHIGWFSLEGPIVSKPCHFRQMVDRHPGLPESERTRELLQNLCERAYRRPPEPGEVDRLVHLAESARADGAEWDDSVAMALQAVLVSPKFLFRMELDSQAQSEEVRPLDEFQLASRLSYFLWSSMPDDELLDLAKRGELRKHLDEQVRRMLADPRSVALIDNFALQWLHLKRLDSVAPDPQMFPEFNLRLRESMLQETRLFLQAILQEDRSVLDLLGTDFTYLNGTLAKHYGIVDTRGHRAGETATGPAGEPLQGPEFRRVTFDEPHAAGLLRQASILTVTSNPTRTSPVKRGRWVLEQLLGKSPPPPPPNIPELDDEHRQLTGTLRERMEQHRQNPSCASCHAQMDPIGFAFENYDAIGRYRTEDQGLPIDASGKLPSGQTFEGPGELIGLLKQREQVFLRCFTDRLLTYALGRGLEYYDRPAIHQIVQSLPDHDHRISSLIVAIVHSDPFQLRRGP